MVEAVVARIEAEDAAEEEARRRRQQDAQQEIAAFLAQQADMRKR